MQKASFIQLSRGMAATTETNRSRTLSSSTPNGFTKTTTPSTMTTTRGIKATAKSGDASTDATTKTGAKMGCTVSRTSCIEAVVNVCVAATVLDNVCVFSRMERAWWPHSIECGGTRPPAKAKGASAAFADDWAHHEAAVARLNHGSFGSAPRPVLAAASAAREKWLAQPDALYFGGGLEAAIKASHRAAARAIRAECACLVENSTVATAIVATRWRRLGGRALVLSVAYGGVRRSLETILGQDAVVVADVPFPGTDHRNALDGLRVALAEHRPRFAMLDHISSQPAIELPVAEMVATCRSWGVREVAIDAAHCLGQFDALDVPGLGADWWFSNVHKWGFAPPSACVLWSGHLDTTRHVVPSWNGSDGLLDACLWTGTRDYASFVAVERALEYLEAWRSVDGETAPSYNRRGLRGAMNDLQRAWNVEPVYDEDACCSALGMVRLPPGLDLSKDAPGQPASVNSLRARLRDRYGVEAAVGGFRIKNNESSSVEGFLRLSHAVYNTDRDFARLRDAVLDLVAAS